MTEHIATSLQLFAAVFNADSPAMSLQPSENPELLTWTSMAHIVPEAKEQWWMIWKYLENYGHQSKGNQW